MEGASTGPSDGVRKGLREYFADHEGNVLTREHLIQWLKQLALTTSKKEIWDAAERIAEYMVDVKGYHTGEDYITGEQEDIEEARTTGYLEISDVPWVRYTAGLVTHATRGWVGQT